MFKVSRGFRLFQSAFAFLFLLLLSEESPAQSFNVVQHLNTSNAIAGAGSQSYTGDSGPAVLPS